MNYNFKVFRSSPILDLGSVWIIITGTQFKTERIETEWYYILNNKNVNIKNALRISSTYFESIDDFWKKETIPNVKNAIYYEVEMKRAEELVKETKDYKLYTLLKDIETFEMAYDSFVSIYYYKKEFIEYIIRTTNCQSLKDYLEKIKKIVIEYTDLS